MLNITSSLWHSRLGHLADDLLTKALDSCNIAYQRNKRDACSACPIAKSHKLPFSLSNSRASHPLALIHTDLWGPAPIPSTTGARYFLLFIDDFSRFSWIYSLHTKDQALPTFIKFKIMVENQFSFCIQCFQSDNGGEFKTFTPYLTTHGITYRCSYPTLLNKMTKLNERRDI